MSKFALDYFNTEIRSTARSRQRSPSSVSLDDSVIRQLLAVIIVAGAFRTAEIAAVPIVLSRQFASSWTSSAVDAKGVRHQAKDYPKGHAPRMEDVTKQIAPEYSKLDQAHRVGGFGLYRIVVDLKTGSVRKVTVIQSTGVATLDSSAMKALVNGSGNPEGGKKSTCRLLFCRLSDDGFSNKSLQPTATRCTFTFFMNKTAPEIVSLAPGSRGSSPSR